MLRILGRPTRFCDGISRREVMRVGGLALGGLSLAELLQRRAEAGTGIERDKSVIMIWLRGGPSHIDSYDMKPNAPTEIRGEFQPISTSVPGIQICEHLPLQARIMDKLAIIRGIKSNDLGDHTPHYLLTGSPDRGIRPALGSIVSYLRPRSDGLPPYVSMMNTPEQESARFLGPAHEPFTTRKESLATLSLSRGVSRERLVARRNLLDRFDTLRRRFDDHRGTMAFDASNARALEMILCATARDAFDLGRESAQTRERYGKFCENFLLARRLVEAGVPVVTLRVGDWDTHEKNFKDMRAQLPPLDQGFHALVSDLHDRGLSQNVAVVMWGEFGRAPQISRGDGRDHWPDAGAAVLAGGGFKTGQVIGDTDAQGARSTGVPYTPSNVLASLYQHLGIDPAATLLNREQRPVPLLDDPVPVRELR